METGAVREAPWFCLRDDDGKPYFANLITGVTQWPAPDGWMDGWRARVYPIAGWPTREVTTGERTIVVADKGYGGRPRSTSVQATFTYGGPDTRLQWHNSHGPFDGRSRGLRYLGVEMRCRIEGGAPPSYYRRAHGKPQYPPDWYDSPQTYPEWALVEWQRSEQGAAEASQYIYGRGIEGAHKDVVVEHLIASSAARDKRE